MNASIFITATDTNAGKTWLSKQLIQALLESGINAKALKPIACGLNINGKNDDIETLLHAQQLSQRSDINHYCFPLATAPSIAAQAEGKTIDPTHLQTWCSEQAENVDLCLIEGIGGLMVPITPQYLVSDWLSDMPEIPIILVVGAKLGCINHALLSLSLLSHMGCDPAWVVINQCTEMTDTQAIKEAIQPYLPSPSNMIECAYQQPDSLRPLLAWLQNRLHQ
ncbi:MAG: dethiobiotin synthase [Mariprofundaceae bacterium]|nr:dethiobiotin synthase [Mariprofundaceae bacterium]